MNRKNDVSLWRDVSLAALAGYGAYLLIKNVMSSDYYFEQGELHGKLTKPVADKLPLAKDLPTINDSEGNYDIDGVSYDSVGVVVGSDKVSSSNKAHIQ